MVRSPAVLLLIASCGLSQPFSFGAKVGVPVTDFVQVQSGTPATSTTNRYIAGASFEVRLPLSLGIEFDALYTRTGRRHISTGTGSRAAIKTRRNSWQGSHSSVVSGARPGSIIQCALSGNSPETVDSSAAPRSM